MPEEDRQGISYRLQLFGGPALLHQGEVVDLSPFQAALLGMLLGSPRSVLSRSEILSRFWPDEDATRARKRLNQLIYSLKKRTGPCPILQARGERLHAAAGTVRTDLEEFLEALQDRRLETCRAMVRSGFLRELEGAIHRSFSDWIVERGAELNGQLRREAERQWLECERAGEWAEAAAAVEILLDYQPTDEGLLRRLMEARGRAGQGAEAEAAYRDFQTGMESRRGGSWMADPATSRLLEQIQAGAARWAEPVPVTIPGAEDDPPLVGRGEERSLLRRTLRRVPHQTLRPILLLGEAGIGKTRLIREALQGIHVDGQQVLAGSAAELEQLIPLNPLIEALRATWVGERLRGLEEPWRTVLFGVMPGHFPGDGPIPEAPQIQPGSVPRRLFEAFHQLLLKLASEGPLILVVEDLQWADQTSLTVLDFLLRRWDQGGLQMVLSVRSEEIHRNSALTPFLEGLRASPDLLEVNLGELDGTTAESLIRTLSSERIPRDDVAYLHSLAGGNPFFLIEMTMEFLAGRVDPDPGNREPLQIPLSIRQVLGRRLSQLSPEAEKALGSMTVHTRPMSVQGIAKVARIGISQCLTGIDQLVQFRLVSVRGAEVVVRHELIRQTVYHSLAEPTRAWLHGRVAQYLLKTRERPPVDELAVHFARAGMAEEAREYALEAAARAESSGAIHEALRFLRIAREHTEDPEAVAELIGRMGHLHYLHQNLEEAAPLLELAAGRFRMRGQTAKALEAEVERIDCLGQTGRLPLEDCIEELDRVKEEARELSHWEVLQGALDVEAHHWDRKGDLEGIRAVLNEARECLDLGGPEARCKAHALVALNTYFGDSEEALSSARTAARIARETGRNELVLHALNRLMLALHYQGLLNTSEGADVLSEAERRSVNCGDLVLKFNIRLNAAVWFLETGALPQAAERLKSAGGLLRGSRAHHSLLMLHTNLGELALSNLEIGLALREYSTAERLLTASTPPYFQSLVSSGLGLCSLHEGNLGEARKRELALAPLPAFWTFDPSIILQFKSRMLQMRRDHRQAIRLLRQVREAVKSRFVTAWIRLGIEEASVLRRVDAADAEQVLRECLLVAEGLGFHERVEEISRLLRLR